MTSYEFIQKYAPQRWYSILLVAVLITIPYSAVVYYAHTLAGVPMHLWLVPFMWLFYTTRKQKNGTADCFDCGVYHALGWVFLIHGAIEWLAYFVSAK